MDNEAKKANQTNNDNIEELNSYLIAEKEKLIKLLEELKQKAETGSSEQSNSNQENIKGNSKQKREEEGEDNAENKRIKIDLTKKPAEFTPQNPDDVKKIKDLEKNKENKNSSLEEAKKKAIEQIQNWELEYGFMCGEVELGNDTQNWVHYSVYVEKLNSVEAINNFLPQVLEQLIEASEREKQEIINAPIGESTRSSNPEDKQNYQKRREKVEESNYRQGI